MKSYTLIVEGEDLKTYFGTLPKPVEDLKKAMVAMGYKASILYEGASGIYYI